MSGGSDHEGPRPRTTREFFLTQRLGVVVDCNASCFDPAQGWRCRRSFGSTTGSEGIGARGPHRSGRAARDRSNLGERTLQPLYRRGVTIGLKPSRKRRRWQPSKAAFPMRLEGRAGKLVDAAISPTSARDLDAPDGAAIPKGSSLVHGLRGRAPGGWEHIARFPPPNVLRHLLCQEKDARRYKRAARVCQLKHGQLGASFIRFRARASWQFWNYHSAGDIVQFYARHWPMRTKLREPVRRRAFMVTQMCTCGSEVEPGRPKPVLRTSKTRGLSGERP